MLTFLRLTSNQTYDVIGLSSWSSHFAPCAMCDCTKDSAHSSLERVSSSDLPWSLRDDDSYEQACQHCEVSVLVSTNIVRNKIIQDGRLKLHKRKKGPSGMVLDADVLELGLKQGDRLEPSSELIDVHSFHTVALPIRVRFWRVTWTTGQQVTDFVRHRCPLFSQRLHTSPHRIVLGLNCIVVLGRFERNP